MSLEDTRLIVGGTNVHASSNRANRAPLISSSGDPARPWLRRRSFRYSYSSWGILVLLSRIFTSFWVDRYAWTGGRLSFAIRSAKGMQVVLGRGGRYIQGRYIPCLQEGDASVTSKQASARMLGERFVHMIGSAGK